MGAGADHPVAWVLNLDADLELAVGARYAPTNAVRAAMAPHVERLAASLLLPDDVLVTEASTTSAAGLVGHAFCPTDRAIAFLERAGARPAPRPAPSVLRLVNGRAFCASLGATLPDGVFASDLETAVRTLAGAPSVAKQWRAKRAFGMAGRGQRRIAAGAMSAADVSFLRTAIAADGGIRIEPDVDVVRELGIHGMLARHGEASFGRIVEQRCDEHGQWLATVLAEDVDEATARALATEAGKVADALHRAGYFGPFGIDAFVYRDLSGVTHLQARSEINARYSMGFAVGFGSARLRPWLTA